MWKREEPAETVVQPAANVPAVNSYKGGGAAQNVIIGKSIVVKGELHGSEDLTVEGTIEGKIALKQHMLTIGAHGRIRAQVLAKSVVVLGEVVGNVEATEKISIRSEGTVEGDLKAPRVAIAEGAKFRGGIDMQQGQQASRPRSEQKSGVEPRKAGVEPRKAAPASASPRSAAKGL